VVSLVYGFCSLVVNTATGDFLAQVQNTPAPSPGQNNRPAGALVRLARVTYRLIVLLIVSSSALLWFAVTALLGRKRSHRERTRWLQRTCRLFLARIGVSISVQGLAPASGLIASNHLSYMDILVLSTVSGCSFVSKMEVRDWPIFGSFAKLAGTVFVRRESRNDAVRAQSDLQQVLADGECVVLFPEGTTSDASGVLPFRTPMFQAVIDANVPMTPCAISYALRDGDVGQELCYWGDMTLLPHLLNLFTKEHYWCSVSFGETFLPSSHRKQLAEDLHARVSALKLTNDEHVRAHLE
jgi:lyso-ornithine lipid O-acyltransferase